MRLTLKQIVNIIAKKYTAPIISPLIYQGHSAEKKGKKDT
mgnify:CR=1 FL=1